MFVGCFALWRKFTAFLADHVLEVAEVGPIQGERTLAVLMWWLWRSSRTPLDSNYPAIFTSQSATTCHAGVVLSGTRTTCITNNAVPPIR